MNESVLVEPEIAYQVVVRRSGLPFKPSATLFEKDT